MTFEIAQKEGIFWSAYYENVDERDTYNEPRLEAREFYNIWIGRDQFEKNLENEQ